LLSFGAESFAFQFAIQIVQKQKHNFACNFLWLEICPFTLREECRWGEFENRVLRRIFGPKRDKVTGKCRKLHNE
jgi:hypothetical protein